MRKERSASDYQIMKQVEHVLQKPGMYVGSVTPAETVDYVYDVTNDSVQKKTFLASEAVKRIFIEILSNAVDNVFATRHFSPDSKDGKYRAELLSMRAPPVSITVTDKTVTVKNGGAPIPIVPHTESTPESLAVIPKVIFGTLMSSSNYDSAADRVGAGTNGYGAKLANIFSTEFRIRVADPENGQLYEGTWRNNMSEVAVDKTTPGFAFSPVSKSWVTLSDPKAKRGAKAPYSGASFVEVSYDLDFGRFKPLTGYTSDIIGSFARAALDYSFTAKILVHFNGKILDARLPLQFAKYYFARKSGARGADGGESSEEEEATPSRVVSERAIVHYEWATKEDAAAAAALGSGKDAIARALISGALQATPTVELIVLDTPNANSSSSTKDLGYVNGICVPRGVHIGAAASATAQAILAASPAVAAMAKSGVATMTWRDVRAHFSVIANCHLLNPDFTSQTKQELTVPTPRIQISPTEFRLAMTSTSPATRWLLAERLAKIATVKEQKAVSKGDGKKQSRVDVPELDDANDAGKANSLQCTLIITEGESAAKYAGQRIDHLEGGKNRFGVFPLRGKPLNVLGASTTRLCENKEYVNIKKCLGLEEGVDYSNDTNAKKLRYGRVLIIADADEDGSAIRSLVINLFGQRWPSLLSSGRVAYLATPAVRVYDTKTRRTVYRFFSDSAFDRWAATPEGKAFMAKKGIEAKHIKGLATSDKTDVKEDVWTSVTLEVVYDRDATKNLDLAFSKKRANDRKEWIAVWKGRQGSETKNDELEECSKSAAATASAKVCGGGSRLLKAVPNRVAPMARKTVSAVINEDLAEYSFGSLRRAIPSVLDNLNHARRQVLWHSLNYWGFGIGERALKKSLRVTQLSGGTTQSTQYMHGEKSLNDCIVSLAQGFAGTNNVPILMPQGQYGDRVRGPKEAGAPRYIQTRLNWIARHLFFERAVDLVELEKVSGETAESKWLPCDISLAAMNGVWGIATGWASFIPNHHPVQIVDWYLARINNLTKIRKMPEVAPNPWYAGFRGGLEIVQTERAVKLESTDAVVVKDDDVSTDEDERSAMPRESPKAIRSPGGAAAAASAPPGTKMHQALVSTGIFRVTRQPTPEDPTYDFVVEELPVMMWTKTYEIWLSSLIKIGRVGDFKNNSKTATPNFAVFKFDTRLLTPAERKIVTATRKGKVPATKSAPTAPTAKGAAAATKSAPAKAPAERKFPPPPLTHESAGLVKKFPMNNMVLLQDNGAPRRFRTVSEILDAHFAAMNPHYAAVKKSRLEELGAQLERLRSRRALVEAIVTETLVIYRRTKEAIRNDVVRMGLSLKELETLKVTELDADDVTALTAKIAKLEDEFASVKSAHHLKLWESRLLEFRKELVARLEAGTLAGEAYGDEDDE